MATGNDLTSYPRITGQEIEWDVDQANHIDASRHVRERLDFANSAYPMVLAQRVTEGERQLEATHREKKVAIEEAQRRLDEAR